MGNFTKSFIFIFSVVFFSITDNYAQNLISNDELGKGNDGSVFESNYLGSSLTTNSMGQNELNNTVLFDTKLAAPCDPPVVNSPIYLCQNSAATPLVVTPSTGGTLNWYGTNATGGTASAIAPVPSTTTVGSTTYYLSQTIGGCESIRVPIVVNIVANNGAVILNLRCDPSQILPQNVGTSVFFDWSNNPLISNTYSFSYTIQGGPAITGIRNVSNLPVLGMLPGQSCTLTLTSTTHPCVPPQTITCSVPCGTSTITPNFPAITPFCTGSVAPTLGTTSPNGVVGTWAPATVSNTVSGNYVFTPNAALNACATTQTLNVTVTPLVTPTFSTIPTTVCQNVAAPILPTSSSNTPAITGTWNPAVVNTATLGNTVYTFTPNPGQCASATLTTASITIVPVITPNFAAIPAFCSGDVAPLLLNTSPNGITGTWSPNTISNTTGGNYLFTPNSNQCATTQTLSVTILPRLVPNFAAIPPFCSGTIAPLLGNTSPNGINGTWSPAVIDNTASGSYTFTPNPGQCANTQILTVTVTPLIVPNFEDIAVCFGGSVPALNTISPNGISGTWSPSTIDNMLGGVYIFTPNINECASPAVIDVTINTSSAITADYTVTNAFESNQVITVIPTTPGNYLYQLDSGSLQTSPIFENVASGLHTITVYDVDGCSPALIINNVLVINYPLFFTPNGDSYNDTWNISSLSYLANSTIFIFDRYGKLLKQINPNGLGWDGTYNGEKLPSTDYWFTVNYMEAGSSKEFKSHFSLKR